MHTAAFDFVKGYATDLPISVIEIGSRDINGSVRPLFPNATWTGLDLIPGPAVDWVGDARLYRPETPVDIVVCCEMIEHCERWKEVLNQAVTWLNANGKIIITCGGPGRAEHSAVEGGHIMQPGEYYSNVDCMRMKEALHEAGFVRIQTFSNHETHDTYAVAYNED